MRQKDKYFVEVTYSKALQSISFKIQKNDGGHKEYLCIPWQSEHPELRSALPAFLQTCFPVKNDKHPIAETDSFYVTPEQGEALKVLIDALAENINAQLQRQFNEGTSLLVRMNRGTISVDDFIKHEKRQA